MDATLAARALAIGRIALGLGLFLAPRRLSRTWLGRDAEGGNVTAVVRGLAARDVAVGVGILVALRGDEPAQDAERWIEAGIVGDLGDSAGTLLAGKRDRDGMLVVAIAGGAALAGILIRTRLR